MTGKWSQAGVPHKGWICIDLEDLGAPDAFCEMCKTRIRYVHRMKHLDYPEILGVGCVCAEKMENDYEAPRQREHALRNAAQRRRRWLSREWKISENGNDYLNTDGLNVAVFQKASGLWGARIVDRTTGQSEKSKGQYTTKEAAKLAAFDKMIFLKQERGWGSF